MNIITATKSNNTITVLVNDNGSITPIPVTSEHPKWTDILKAWTEQNFEALLELMSMKRIVERFSNGDLVVSDSGVFYKDVPLVGIDVDRIMAFLRTNEPFAPIAKYMVLKLKNPSKRAINEMYNFLEHKQMPLTPDGTILAYKGVQKNFFSVSFGNESLLQGRRNEAGQIFNGVGETIEMNRSDVDDDFRQGCSAGLHAGSLQYARDWAKSHNGTIIVIEIDPANVVSVPEDCNCMKLRCSKYKVIGLYNGPLPDTYTDEFSETSEDRNEECAECGQNPCEYDPCPECGEDENYCHCNEECPECEEYDGNCTCDKDKCGCCNASYEKCYPDIQPMQGPITEAIPMAVTLPIEKESARDLLGLNEPTEEAKFRQKFVAMVCEQSGCDPADVTDNKTFMDLGFDSLDGMAFVVALEKEFGREIFDEAAGKYENDGTIGDIMADLWAVRHPQAGLETLDTEKKLVPNDQVADTYQQGYDLGFRNGVRRRKRLYYQEDEPVTEFERGYCDGYRAGRKDYKH